MNRGQERRPKNCPRCGDAFVAIVQKNASGKVVFEDEFCGGDECRKGRA